MRARRSRPAPPGESSELAEVVDGEAHRQGREGGDPMGQRPEAGEVSLGADPVALRSVEKGEVSIDVGVAEGAEGRSGGREVRGEHRLGHAIDE